MNFCYTYVVRMGGYFGTKDRRTRAFFRKTLIKNIKVALQNNALEEGKDFKIEDRWDHLIVESNSIIDHILSRVFGIATFSRCKVIEFNSLDELLDKASRFFQPYVLGRRFGVRASGEKGISARKIERELGSMLVPWSYRVDLTNPEIWCYVDVKKGKGILYTSKEEGARGVPVGVQGHVLMLFSGGIDSPVAAWKLLKSGCTLDYLYFDLGSKHQFECMSKTLLFLHEQWGAGYDPKVIIIPFQPVISEILNRPPYYQNLLLKFFFYRIAEQVARDVRAKAIATGESLGQVSTQTLANLSSLERVAAFPVFRPLLTMEKDAIVKFSRKIGTYDLSYKGEEYCAIARHGVGTRIPYLSLLRQAFKCNLEVLSKVYSERKILNISELKKMIETKAEIMSKMQEDLSIHIPEDAVVIDLRMPEEFAEYHIPGSKNIPFSKAWVEFPHWDKSKKYFLICGEGLASALLAHHMRSAGFKYVDHLNGGIRKWYKSKISKVKQQ